MYFGPMKSVSSGSHPSHSLLGELRALANRSLCVDVLVLDARALRVWAAASGDGLLIDVAGPALHDALEELRMSGGELLDALREEALPVSHPPSPTAAEQAGSLGPLEIMEVFEDDGRSTVFRARVHSAAQAPEIVVVRHVQTPACTGDAALLELLEDTRRTARLTHPNVAQVFEVGIERDAYWIVMENLQGERLRDVMRGPDTERGAARWVFAVSAGIQVAEALHAIHGLYEGAPDVQALTYQHLSSRSVVVTHEGRIKLLPLSTASYLGPEPDRAYQPPEQVQGEPLDRRADVFALGAMLWELATGTRLAALGAGPAPAPSTISGEVPAELDTIILRALAPRREARFATALEMAQALRALLVSEGVNELDAPVRAWFASRQKRKQPASMDRLETSGGPRASLRARALRHLAATVSADTVRRGEPVRFSHASEKVGYIAVSFARLYLLVLLFDGPFEPTRAKVALKRSLPRIQSLMSAIAAEILS
ncbi:MAG: protein kinase domain-containing protein [Myxococcota bacterium]